LDSHQNLLLSRKTPLERNDRERKGAPELASIFKKNEGPIGKPRARAAGSNLWNEKEKPHEGGPNLRVLLPGEQENKRKVQKERKGPHGTISQNRELRGKREGTGESSKGRPWEQTGEKAPLHRAVPSPL